MEALLTNLPIIVEADIVQYAQDYTGERFHAILCDPPYALISIAKRFGKKGSTTAKEGMDGRFSRLSSGFMQQEWDSFENLDQYREWIAIWAKLLIDKMLYPGAVCLFFGGTRTYHHLALGLEQGGFEIFDALMWLTGQGFPKSHSLEKQIQGDAYKGYGTALKPAWECILLCRAPRKGATFASLALEHGSGSLNIDGSRIEGKPRTTHKNVNIRTSTKEETMFEGIHIGEYPGASGRWPANLLLSHHEDCQKIGTFEVPARVINRWLDGMKPFGDGAGGKYETVHPTRQGEASADKTYEDEGGTDFAMKPGPRRDKDMETVERWACVPECPIRQLDDQVGILNSGKGPVIKRETSKGHLGMAYGSESREAGTHMIWHGGSGGPSRFFKMFSADEYCFLCYNTCTKAIDKESDLWRHLYVGFVEQNLETTSVIGGVNKHIARLIALPRASEKLVHYVKSAGNLCDLCAISIAHVLVVPKIRDFSEEELHHILDYIIYYKRCILIQNLVYFAEIWENTGITPTMKDLSILFGSVLHAITNCIPEIKRSGISRFKYAGKAARQEKDKGLENFFWKRTGKGFERVDQETWAKLERRERARGCIHPTVKPLAVCRYISKLILPPQRDDRIRRILIPFSGSGSEIIAAKQAGWDIIVGIEMNSLYNDIARARIDATIGMF